MALVSPPLVMQLGMTSCSYDGDDPSWSPERACSISPRGGRCARAASRGR